MPVVEGCNSDKRYLRPAADVKGAVLRRRRRSRQIVRAEGVPRRRGLVCGVRLLLCAPPADNKQTELLSFSPSAPDVILGL